MLLYVCGSESYLTRVRRAVSESLEVEGFDV